MALGLNAPAASTTTYCHNDLTGSPLVATDGRGHVLWRETYRPYGERLVNSASAKGNDVWFTSRRQDAETGLVYVGARYYDPVAGRFASIDPKQFDEANGLSFNRYAYGNDNPLKYRDPDGKLSIFVNEMGPNDAAARTYNDSVRSTFGGATDAVAAVTRKYLIALSIVATLEGGGAPVSLRSKKSSNQTG